MASNKFGNATSDAASLDIQCNEISDVDLVTNCDESSDSPYSTKQFIVHFTHRICLVGCDRIVQLYRWHRITLSHHYGQLDCHTKKWRHFNI